MNYWEARSILPVQENAAAEEIKKAYAEKVKACNPETDPEGWMRLHEAYKLLLFRTERTGAVSPKPETPPTEEGRQGADKEDGEFDGIFEGLDENIRTEKEAQRSRLAAKFKWKILRLLFGAELFPVTERRLKRFMDSPDYIADRRSGASSSGQAPFFRQQKTFYQ